MLKAGQPAPEFTATTHHGKSLSLSELRGHKVLIWFFPEAGTPGCTTEGRSFQEQRNYFDENNVVVLGASFNSVEENAAFANRNQFDFPLLCDGSRALALAYGACASASARNPERISVLIDEHGIVSQVYQHVDPRNHAAQVLIDLIEPEADPAG
jgi:thioredoxin-dependent peroxiredoxin